jgi:succinate-semialdehyde dehydrogenase/glutarate-semialdehyde dehydrogenase
LKDPSLFIEKSYINGEWVDAKSGQTFEVHGKQAAEQSTKNS